MLAAGCFVILGIWWRDALLQRPLLLLLRGPSYPWDSSDLTELESGSGKLGMDSVSLNFVCNVVHMDIVEVDVALFLKVHLLRFLTKVQKSIWLGFNRVRLVRPQGQQYICWVGCSAVTHWKNPRRMDFKLARNASGVSNVTWSGEQPRWAEILESFVSVYVFTYKNSKPMRRRLTYGPNRANEE